MNTMVPNTHSVRRRRRIERTLVGIVIALIVLFGFLEGWFFRFDPNFPIASNILLFALINLNAILLLVLSYFVLRNIVKLIFERKRNILGHKLRTRLVIAFIGLTLIPTLPLFLIATQFISSSLDYWFSNRVEQSLQQAVSIAQDYLQEEKKVLVSDSELALAALTRISGSLALATLDPLRIPSDLLRRNRLEAIYLVDGKGELQWQRSVAPAPSFDVSQVLREWKKSSAKHNNLLPATHTFMLPNQQEWLVARLPVSPLPESTVGAPETLLMFRLLPQPITDKFAAVTSGYDNYLQLKLLQHPLKTSHFITFSIVTLLVMFAAIWFGFFLAKTITMPIQEMVAATQRIAYGDLSVHVDLERDDEMGMLVSSFNKMVRDLREIQDQLATAYGALQASHTELEDRRRSMETVLKNIAAGVVSVDANGKVMTINKSAEAMFGLHAEEVIGEHYERALQSAHVEIVQSFIDLHVASKQPYLEQQVNTVVAGRPMVLLIKASILKDDEDRTLGVVVVFDDLTDLEKAQRMAAWREVARRIAHEVKNPLTPIKLSAERLRRKYVENGDPQGSLLDECTQTIVQQVDLMKRLVDEFSNFARLPRANPVPCDLGTIVEETLSLYRHSYPTILFQLEKDDGVPPLRLDREQFKQVMINLLDNAVHALNGGENYIRVRLSYDRVLKIAVLECADSGHGLSPEDKLRIFEPYFSTKEKGTGLGLAIVASIVADHHGFIRVRDNTPRGTVIIIELPG